jgi:FkbM family methyltransferase
MKETLRWLARTAGYDIVRHVDMPDHPIDVRALAVGARVAAGQSVRFVQIGANDGLHNDPIRHLVLKHRLPGLFVEPIPDIFARLRENYVGQPGVEFEQCAVGEKDGTATMYRVRPSPDLPAWLQGLASFDKGHLTTRKLGYPGLERHVESVTVPVLSLPSLLRKHGADSCDLLQVDTEGYDCRIVTWAIQTGLRPAIINYEFIHTPPKERAKCKRLLADQGYAFIDVGRDTLALLTAQGRVQE